MIMSCCWAMSSSNGSRFVIFCFQLFICSHPPVDDGRKFYYTNRQEPWCLVCLAIFFCRHFILTTPALFRTLLKRRTKRQVMGQQPPPSLHMPTDLRRGSQAAIRSLPPSSQPPRQLYRAATRRTPRPLAAPPLVRLYSM